MPEGAKNSWRGNLKPQASKSWELLWWEAFLLLLLNLFLQVALSPSWGEGPTPGPSHSWMAHSLHLPLLLLDSQRKVKVMMGKTVLHRLLPRHHRRQQLRLHPHLPLLNQNQLKDQDRLVALTTTVLPIRTAIEGAYFLWNYALL